MTHTVECLKGMRDLFEEDLIAWRWVETVFARVAQSRGYVEVRTPLLEHTELFARGLGAATAVVGKEMYAFPDKKGLSVCLRPEGTASVARAVIASGKTHTEPFLRLYYGGPMFRYERPQKGRQRQFHQLGIEVFGLKSSASDCSVIALADALFTELGLKQRVRLLLNSLGCATCRSAYLARLKEILLPALETRCRDCQERALQNPLRIFDCKNDTCRNQNNALPKLSSHLCEACDTHFKDVKTTLTALGISFEHDENLVRGLDYYSRTAFEWRADGLGAQDAIGGGGRYDGLITELGGRPTPAIGFAIGVERLLIALEAAGITPPQKEAPIAILPLDPQSAQTALILERDLLARGLTSVTVNLSETSLKSQLREASKTGARAAIIIGEAERSAASAIVKNMATGEQTTVSMTDLLAHLLKKI